MVSEIILLAETGSDITPELARQLNVRLVPMHVSMGNQTLDDGAFPAEDVCAYYDRTGKAPTTSGSTLYDFEKVYEEIFTENPHAQVLYLAYSAVTTCSYHSAGLALEGKPYAGNVRLVDTKHVSVGQCAAVTAVFQWLKVHPEATLDEAAAAAVEISKTVKMCFIPKNLDYLRAGGRVSNAVAMVGNLLNLHPCIDILDGKLIAGKKYRGNMDKVLLQYIKEQFEKYDNINPKRMYITHSGVPEERLALVKKAVEDAGIFEEIYVSRASCTISTHCGPGTLGVLFMEK